jgi:small-conductance mechanosensitive channel
MQHMNAPDAHDRHPVIRGPLRPCSAARRYAVAGCLALLAVLAAIHPRSVEAQENALTVTAGSDVSEATLTYLNRPIFTFRSSIGTTTPEERAERSHQRLADLTDEVLSKPIELKTVTLDDQNGVILTIGGNLLFGIAPGDVDPEYPLSVDVIADDAKRRLEEAFAARLEQQRMPVIVRALALTAAATALLAGLIWLVWRVRLRVGDWFHTLISARIEKAAKGRLQWKEYGLVLTHRVMQLVTGFAILLLLYIWLAFSLRQFPVTQPVGERLRGFFIDVASDLGLKAVSAVPGIVTVGIIFLIAQALSHALSNVAEAVESRRLSIPFVQSDTARATRQILRFIIWGIALAVAHPYIPGSDSLAFQGLSVLFGLMISLGSTGIVSQMMSGTVVAYTRALHVGDYVSIGEVEGMVSEVGTISTKLVTMSNEEVTIPNSVLIENTIRNYSQSFAGSASLVSTKITIGYDTPWRQVHAMLLMAADQVEGVCKAPAPYVFQRALTDFYAEYELFALVELPMERLAVLSALHGKIQDVFNTYGVQIMSPQYYEQPPQPLIVPKEKWFTAPAKDAEEGKQAAE